LAPAYFGAELFWHRAVLLSYCKLSVMFSELALGKSFESNTETRCTSQLKTYTLLSQKGFATLGYA